MSTSSTKLMALPLFPLNTVLFPGGSLPLRIFEVRYLDMIGTRHKAGQPFGVVCLSEGSETRRRSGGTAGGEPAGDGFAHEAFFSIGTLARITKLERPQPGLMMIACVGSQRFRVARSEQLKHGLWIADVELLADDAEVPVPEDLNDTRDALQAVVRNIELGIDQGGADAFAAPLFEPYRWDDCGWLANRWCELLPLEPEMKQRLMSLDSPVLRLELVADALGQIGFDLPE
jgi:Lon protease-like protein